jgi:hypothetical protein
MSSERDRVGRLVSRLEESPVTLDLAVRAPETGGIPDMPGFYLWWAVANALPEASGRPHPRVPELRAFYVGISPARGDSRQRLRGRVVGNHIRGNTAASTFRFALAALLREALGYQACVRIGARGRRKYVLPSEQNEDLNAWQQTHLRVSWATCKRPWDFEEAVIAHFQPPLNSAENAAHPFSAALTKARRNYRETAIPRRDSEPLRPPAAIRQRIDDFLLTRPKLQSRDGADNQCRIATDELVETLMSHGVEAHPTWVRGHRTMPVRPARRAMAATRHRIVRLPRGAFVDVTRRQFDDHAAHPTYYASELELADHWREIDRGPVDGSLADEDWRSIA